MVWPLLGGAVALAVACGSTVAAAPQVSVRVDATETISQTDPGYKCWNIDGSAIRQWDTRDLSSPLLASLGRQSLPGYLRFGGSGNNNLRYALDMSDESSAGNRCAALSGSERCLNRTWVDHLANFAQRSGAKLVFGLNMAVCDSSEGSGNCFGEPWAAGEAKILMEYLIQANHSVFGFELGNEMDEHYTASQTAANFRALSDLLTQLWPQTSSRPKLIGPDVHGFHSDPLTSTADGRKLEFLVDFVRNCSRLHVPLHAATHHEYVDVDPYPATPPNASQLQVTNEVGSAVNDSLALAAPSVQIWAGEIGPHNGGKEGHKPAACGTDHRWANFADSQWYLDAMGVKAANGYKAFCRQDFVGIDYGMIDCVSYAPLPDYYSGILWSKLMGTSVLQASSSDAMLRAYAHCSADHGGATTVLLIHLDPSVPRTVLIDGLDLSQSLHENASGSATIQWHLTGPNGPNSSEVALNGRLLVAKVVAGGTEYDLPSLDGRITPMQQEGGFISVEMAPASIAFVELETPSGVCSP